MNEVKLLPKGFGGIPKRDWTNICIRVMRIFPLAWNQLFKALHFTESAKERYQYALRAGERRGGLPRKGSYTAKKLRLYGHQLALVFTGRGMREAQANNAATAGHRNSGEFWAKATLPNIFNLRNPRGRTNPAEEVTKVLPSEEQQLEPLSQRKLDAEIRRRSDHMGFVE